MHPDINGQWHGCRPQVPPMEVISEGCLCFWTGVGYQRYTAEQLKEKLRIQEHAELVELTNQLVAAGYKTRV